MEGIYVGFFQVKQKVNIKNKKQRENLYGHSGYPMTEAASGDVL